MRTCPAQLQAVLTSVLIAELIKKRAEQAKKAQSATAKAEKWCERLGRGALAHRYCQVQARHGRAKRKAGEAKGRGALRHRRS